jgi:multiple sugar transport system substrate-binding protein
MPGRTGGGRVYRRRRAQRRPPRRPAALLAATAVALAALTAACTSGGAVSGGGSHSPAPSPGSSTSPASPTSSATSSGPPVPVSLRFAVYGGRADLRAYQALARSYMHVHPEVTMHVETARDGTASVQRLRGQLAAGRAPDVFLADSSNLPTLVGDDRVQPVDRLLEQRNVAFGERYERLGLEAFSADSSLQCMPNNVSPQVVFYNKRLLTPSEVSVPGVDPPSLDDGWSWAQFEAAARTISAIGVTGVYLDPALTTLTPFLRSAGADVVDDPQAPTRLMLSDPGSRDTMRTILGLARDRGVNLRPTPSPGRSGPQDALERFETGRLGMLIGTRALVPRLRHQPGLRFDVYQLPSLGTFHTTADVTGYCISRTSQHVDAAADFIAYASSDVGAKITARSGGIVPANLAALQSAAFKDPHQLPRHVAVFTTVIRQADTMPDAAGWSDVVSETQPLLNRLFYAPHLTLGPLLTRIDQLSQTLLAQASPSPTPTS